jgi:hypothetical protein
MKKNLLVGNKYFQYFTLITVLLLFPFLKGIAQVSLTNLGTAYTQNFDGLASSSSSSVVPSGWAFSEAGTTANLLYSVGTGSSNSGDTYSFGAASNGERAFGTLLSGSVNSTLGASFTNGTGSAITSLNISYIGEQWRFGATGRADQLNFEYSLNATSLTNGTWTSVSALNFVTPNTSTVVGAVNGNLTGNKTSISSTIGSLSIAVGGTVWIRWTDFNATGSDDGLGIDDFSITPNGTTQTPPTQLAITSITPTSPLAGSGFSVTVQSRDGSNVPQNVVANTVFSLSTNGNAGAIGGTITGTINAGSSSAVVSGVTLSTGGTSVNITATRTSGDALTAATSSTFTVVGLATQLAFVGVPSSGYVGSNIAAFTVEARRADNSVDVNFNGTIIVSKASGPGILSGTTSVTAVSGVATFSVLQFDQVGTYSLITTSSTLTSATSSPIIISPTPVTWDFTSASATNIPTNLSVSVMSQGNNNGTTTMITNGSASSGYTGVSGLNNAGAAARTGALVTGSNGSAYFEFTLTPNPNYVVTLNAMSFGSRSTSTGPAAFSIRSSLDNYVSNIGTGTLLTSGTWALSNPSIASTSSKAGSGVTFRIYGHSGTGSPSTGTANWRIDDVLLNLTVSACTQPNILVNSGSICEGNSFTITPSGGVTYSVTGSNFTVTPTATTDYTVNGADAIGCTNSVVSSVIVNTAPIISVNSGSICAGNSFTISPSGANTYTFSSGTAVVSPSTNTNYTVTGTSAQGCLSNQAISSVTVNSLPVISISGNTASICAGSSVTLTANGGNTYLWNTGETTPLTVVSPASTTSYTVTGTDLNDCSNISVTTVITTTCIATTQLTSASCNSTLTVLNSSVRLYCNPVGGATNYEWQFTDVSTGLVVFTRQRGFQWTDFYLTGYFPNIQYNKTYSVKVRAYVGGTWGSFGNACTVTTPATVLLPTKLTDVYCGTTLSTLTSSTKIYCDQVLGATNYEWQITDVNTGTIVLTKQRGAQWTDFFIKGYFPTIKYNYTYSIKVRAYVNGVWGAFGNACNITTPATSARLAFSNNDNLEIENDIIISTYPNPTSEILNVDFNIIPENSYIQIYNMIGEVVLTKQFHELSNLINTSQLTTGLYIVKIIGNNKLLSSQKIVKQ